MSRAGPAAALAVKSRTQLMAGDICTSPAPRAIHVTNGTLAFAFTHAYPSGIATVIVPELMRPAYLAQDAPSTATPSASERGTCSNRVLAPQAKLVTYARTIY